MPRARPAAAVALVVANEWRKYYKETAAPGALTHICDRRIGIPRQGSKLTGERLRCTGLPPRRAHN